MEIVYVKPASVGRHILTTAEPQRFSIALFNVKSPTLMKEGGLYMCEYRIMKFLKLLTPELEGTCLASVLAGEQRFFCWLERE